MTEPPNRPDRASARPHELSTFLQQDAREMQSEYDRIRSISAEDAGTAGDEGEETWANLLRQWLPESYRVVTKGRLLAADGRRGPQVDVVVLRPGYPTRLVTKKLYLVGGVAAAFECKNTLKAEHLRRAFDQASEIDRLSSPRGSSPFAEVVPEVFFGVLAHSTVWRSDERERSTRIDDALQAGLDGLTSLRGAPGLVCVADLSCWSLMHMVYDGPGLMPDDTWQARRRRTGLPPDGAATISYMRFVDAVSPPEHAPPNPIAAAVASILGCLAHNDASVRPLSQYFFATGMQGSGAGVAARAFPLEVYSPEVRARLPQALTNGVAGSDWAMVYSF